MANIFDQFKPASGAPAPDAASPQQEDGGLTLPSDQPTTITAHVSGDPTVMGTITDMAKGVIGGGFDAVNDATSLPVDLASSVGLISEDTAKAARKYTTFLPELSKEETTLGEITRQVTRFGVGFVGAGKLLAPFKAYRALKGAGAAGSIAAGALQGAVGDFIVSDPHEARLSDLIQSVPALENPITEFLASNKRDNAAVGKLKASLEGIVPGVLVESLVMGVKGIAKARRLRAA